MPVPGTARSLYRPGDAYAGDLVTALGSHPRRRHDGARLFHIANSPEHTDAAICGLRDSDIRAMCGYGSGVPGPCKSVSKRYPKTWETILLIGGPVAHAGHGSGHRCGRQCRLAVKRPYRSFIRRVILTHPANHLEARRVRSLPLSLRLADLAGIQISRVLSKHSALPAASKTWSPVRFTSR